MKSRSWAPLAAGVAYAALACWLVSAQGQAYRAALRRDRAAVSQAQTPPAVVASRPPVEATGASKTPPQPPAPPVAEVKPAPAPADVATTTPAPEAPAVALAPLTTPAPRPEPAPARPVKTPAAEWSDSLDLAHLTPEQEARLGAELHALILATNPPDPDGDLQRVRAAAEPLLAAVARKGVTYTFTVLDSDEVNAFSVPGGYVYVSRGLLRLAGDTADPQGDYVLRFALAHEVAHVDLGHAVAVVGPGNAASKAKGVDTLHQFLVPLAIGYPDALERAADAWAYSQMRSRLGHSRREALMLLVRLEGYAERNGFKNGRSLPDPASGRTLVENHYRAHPATWDRLARLRASDPSEPAAK